MLSSKADLREALSGRESLGQWDVTFLRRSTAESWRTLGDFAVRRWCTREGTTFGLRANRLICSSACLLASLSGIRNCISNSSSDCAIFREEEREGAEAELSVMFCLSRRSRRVSAGGQEATLGFRAVRYVAFIIRRMWVMPVCNGPTNPMRAVIIIRIYNLGVRLR